MKLQYRPEIDGLRAISVIAVIIYHSKIHLFNSLFLPGGYYGVDIFFVISGYLITSILISEIKSKKTFSFKKFYIKRARRILPALFVVVALSLPLAWFSVMPLGFVEYSKSILFSLGFTSNFFFYSTGLEYGAVSGLVKPLLHTWSLSVEEQFYILFPIILLFSYNFFKKEFNKLILTIFFLSLIFSLIYGEFNSKLNFYLLPSRAWELLIGSLLVIYQSRLNFKLHSKLNDFICVIGLLLIFLSFIVFYEAEPTPNLKTLVPIFGAILIILFFKKDLLINKILTNRLIVGIGLISYSLYLWHYPIFAFVRSNRLAQGLLEFSFVGLIVFTLAILSYYLIEKPFRNYKKISDGFFLKLLFFSLLFLIFSSILIIKNDGFSKRYPGTETFSLDYQKYLKENRYLKYKIGSPQFKEENKINILVVGNSHGRDTFNSLYLNKNLFKSFEFSMLDSQIRCLTNIFKKYELCDKIKMSKLQKNLVNDADIFLISTSYNEEDLNNLNNLIENLVQNKKKVIVTSQKPSFYFDNYLSIIDEFFLEKERLPNPKEKKIIKKEYFDKMNNNFINLNQKLKFITNKNKIKFLEKNRLICDFIIKECEFLTPKDQKIMFDNSHYTVEGAKYIGEKMYKTNWLDIN